MPRDLELTRQERLDLKLSRRLPRASQRLNLAALRLTGGRLGSSKRGVPIGRLTTTGRRSGQPRTVPLMYLERDSEILIVVSNSGFDPPPAWFLNLEADPRAKWEGAAVIGRQLTAEERDSIWDELVAHNPLWAGFQAETKRRLGVVALRPG